MQKGKPQAQKETKKIGPARKKRSALERKCITRADKILFAGHSRSFFRAIVKATEHVRKLKKGGYKTKDADATTPAAA